MLFRRFTISSLCVLTAAGMVIAADNRNPFAEWDRLKQKTGISESTAGRSSGTGGASLEYFSPNASPPANESVGDQAKPAARQRLQLMNAGTPADQQENSQSSTGVGLPSSVQKTQPVVGQPAIAQAAAEVSADDSQETQVQQVKAEIRDIPQQEEPNPFADFVNEQNLTAEPAASDVQKPAAPTSEVMPGTGTPVVPQPSTSNVDVSSESIGPQSPAVTLQWVQHGDFNVGHRGRVVVQAAHTHHSVAGFQSEERLGARGSGRHDAHGLGADGDVVAVVVDHRDGEHALHRRR